MNFKEFQLDLEALISEIVNGHGFLHYGYWKSEEVNDLTLSSLGNAQLNYFKLLTNFIPDKTKSILDVGSGTGSNALALSKIGYEVSCVCPSSRLNGIARNKLPNSVNIYESTFEQFNSNMRFDTLLFAESFHYINTKICLKKIGELTNQCAIIFDYFPREGAISKQRTKYSEFLDNFENELSANFEIVKDIDMTINILPTFEVLDHIKNHHVRTFANKVIDISKKKYPIRYFFFNLFFKKVVRKILRKSTRASSFLKNYEYRLIIIKRKNSNQLFI